MIRSLLLVFICFFFSAIGTVFASDINDINVRDINVTTTGVRNSMLESFIAPFSEFFFSAPILGGEGIYVAFTAIAFQLKNFFIAIAILFLIFGVLRLLFSPASDEDVVKWRNNIIWVTVGIFIMQISFSVWNTLIIRDTLGGVDESFGYQFWVNIFTPIVGLLQMLAGFAFLMMMIYAFYIMVTGAGDEEKAKKAKSTVIYAIVGFFLIQIPEALVKALYGRPNCESSTWITVGSCEIADQNLSGAIAIVGKIVNFFNTFLTILCVILIIYAGWLVLISGGDEEKLKKAKNIVIYILLGFLVLVASHAIFRFFILRG